MHSSVPFIAWTCIVAIFFAISAHRENESAIDTARIEAKAHFNEIVNIRHWVASLGGVYAPVTSKTRPNPFLKGRVKERDLTTPLGQNLTLLNPAYVTRLLSKNLGETYGVYGKLISNKPVWENNLADAWETKAIEGFIAGTFTDLIEAAEHDGRPHMRYIAPLYLKPSCMTCHQEQGEIGDLRGAVSVAIPLAHHRDLAQSQILYWAGVHGGIWLVGIAGIVFVRRRLNLSIQQLAEAKKKAEETSKAKSEFLASMSHDLRTPLNAILGFSQMLRYNPKNPLSESQDDYVGSIIDGGTHLLELVNGILDLASIEADQFTPTPERANISDILSDCISLIQPLADQQNVKIIKAYNLPNETEVLTDRVQLKQIVLNLVSNAIKFNRKKGSVTVSVAEAENDFLRISISDTGIGISEDKQTNVFEMFHSTSHDPYVAQQGTGIGLYVSKLLIERMAGAIGFESKKNVGSTFWLKIPLASNNKVVIWSKELSVGVDAIDKDHQIIIRLMNQLIHSERDRKLIDNVISELVDYTTNHFRREELVMKICGMPDLEEHRKLHEELSAEVKALEKEWKRWRKVEIADQLHAFLKHLWIDHFLEYDTKFPQYTSGKDTDIRIALNTLN